MTPSVAAPTPADPMPGRPPSLSPADSRLMQAARKLEASFLSEMLRHAGLDKARDSFGGGAGEEQFSSFLRDAQAQAIEKRGGIGLAQNLFESLKEHADASR